tara:strand:+ start:249 stop:572 length:324 start_codon:yes stop_codon:yes gene_type:complete
MSDSIKAKVLNLAELIAYQEGSVVSRTIIKKDTGTVTVFAFDQDQSLSEHTAPFDAMVHIIEGQADVSIGQEHFNVGAGEIIILPANQPHSVGAKEKFKMALVMIRS